MSQFGAAAARLAGLTAMLWGWRPDDFWSLTPAELAAALQAQQPDAGEPPDGAAIAALMERFPDR